MSGADPIRGERRTVTALFADVKGSTALGETLDPEDVVDLVGSCVRDICEVVERFGGTVNDIAGDGVLALFGAPTAHEDDPERAIRAGLEIQKAVRSHRERAAREFGVESFGVRVGVETGLVVVGSVGGGTRIEYGATGDAMNTAARLEARADPARCSSAPPPAGRCRNGSDGARCGPWSSRARHRSSKRRWRLRRGTRRRSSSRRRAVPGSWVARTSSRCASRPWAPSPKGVAAARSSWAIRARARHGCSVRCAVRPKSAGAAWLEGRCTGIDRSRPFAGGSWTCWPMEPRRSGARTGAIVDACRSVCCRGGRGGASARRAPR